MKVLSLLAQQRLGFIGAQEQGGVINTSEAAALSSGVNNGMADLVTAARESLIDDELIRQLAARERVTQPANVNAWSEAATFAAGDFASYVRYVRFGLPQTGGTTSPSGASDWPSASAANLAAATARVKSALTADTPIDQILSGLQQAGWQVIGEDVALSSAGVPADAALEVDPSIAAGSLASAARAGDIVGPTTDLYGRVAIGRVLTAPDRSHLEFGFSSVANKAGVDMAAIQSWANDAALMHALKSSVVHKWATGNVEQAHFREIVIGDAPTSATGSAGPWVDLSALSLDRVAALEPASVSGLPAGIDLKSKSLADGLRALPSAQLRKLWQSLVSATSSGSTTGYSGEMGFVSKQDVSNAISDAVFADKVKPGDLVGPVSTSSGPELFLVKSRYDGVLDDRAKIALATVIDDPAPDPAALTQRFSPGDAPVAADAGWRAQPEFASSEPVRQALFETTIGSLSEPFVLDGKLAFAIPDQRKSDAADPRMLARLTLDGFDPWLSDELAKATITRNPNPLPELIPSASPSASASATATNALQLPSLPTMPGLPAPTPLKTDGFGLPVVQ